MAISIIVPVLDEAANLRRVLGQLRSSCPSPEIIVVDGGSKDEGVGIARELADIVLTSEKGRAVQMNAGARVAHGNILWFVHADSTITPSLAPDIERALLDPTVVGGCFRLRLDSSRAIYRIRDTIGNFLVNLTGIALGDRGFFCRRETFAEVGGYPEIPILEDAEFHRKLKRSGRVVQLHETIGTSARRYEALGPITTVLFYTLIMLLYSIHVPIRFLERMVRGYMTKRRGLARARSRDSES